MPRLHWDYPRRSSGARILLALGQAQGVADAVCLRGTGLSREQLLSSEGSVQSRQELRLARNLLDALGPTFPLGLEAGARSHLTTHGIWGFALLSSATVYDALQAGLRYLSLTSVFSRIVVRETADALELIGEDDELPADLRGFLLERDAAITLCLVQDMLGTTTRLNGLHLKAAAPAYAQQLATHFGCTPAFAQSRNCVFLDRATLSRKLPQADPVTLQSCEQECRKLITRYRTREGYSSQVRDQLLNTQEAMPSMEQVADRLDINARSLRRRLAADGTTFEALRDEVRAALAGELLTQTTLSVEQIAERLGYAEVSCFSRAFKRWEGIPPRDFRQQTGARRG